MHAVVDHFDLQLQFKYMNYFIYTSHHFTLNGRYELNCLASLTMCGFIAQLVEHGTGIAEVTGSNLVEALIFSGFSSFQLLKLEKFTAMIIPPFDLQLQFKYMNYLIYTSHHFTLHGRYELNCLASLTMCGFMAQLVQHGNGIAEVTGSNLVEALIFSGFFFPIALYT